MPGRIYPNNRSSFSPSYRNLRALRRPRPGITDTSRDPATHPNWPPTTETLRDRLFIPRLGEPGEIAEACVFLASDAAAYITGQTLHVSGGFVTP